MLKLALFISIIAACAPKPSQEQLIAEFQEGVKSYQEQMDSLFARYKANPQAAGDIEQQYDAIMAEFKDYSLDIINDNPGSEVAVEAMKTVYYELDDDQLDEIMESFPEESVQNSDYLKKVRQAIAARKATAEGNKFVDFTVKSVVSVDKDGNETVKEVKLSDYVGNGKCILVDFWASWCGPCKAEIPNVAKVYKDYAGDKFDVLSIAVWDKAPAAIKTAVEHGVVWNQIVCSKEDAEVPGTVYGIESIPQIMLFGPDGTILNRDLRGEALQEAVRAALGL